MSDAIAAGLARQSGLLTELRLIASNVANASTDGYKREASVFTEYVDRGHPHDSLSMGALRGRWTDRGQGALVSTGGTFDLAIEGPGLFAVQRGDDVLLTRAGSFQLDAQGRLVTKEGWPVLDEGGGVIEIPEETVDVTVSPDGTVSLDGLATARFGLFEAPPGGLRRAGDTLFRPVGALTFVDEPVIRQGFVEQSNTRPIMEMARLTEAQRLFEAGQDLMNTEVRRLEDMIRILGGDR
jgi:flagellar basal-body rod protein FlgF